MYYWWYPLHVPNKCRIAGKFWGRIFLRLNSIKTLHKLNLRFTYKWPYDPIHTIQWCLVSYFVYKSCDYSVQTSTLYKFNLYDREILSVFNSLKIVHSFFLFWLHYFSDFSIGYGNGRCWQWLRQGSGQAGKLVFYCNDISQVWKGPIKHINKLHVQKFQGIDFQGWGKMCKNGKIYCPQKFPTIWYNVIHLHHFINHVPA